MEIRKIAIMGAGAIGSYYGGLFASRGYDVTFIARGAHLKALQSNGLSLHSSFGDSTLPRVSATDKPETVGTVDLVLFTVKTYDADTAAHQMQPLLADHTIVLPLQTAQVTDTITKYINKKHLLGGVTYISCEIESPGVVKQSSTFRKVVIGEYTKEKTERAQALYDIFAQGGIDTLLTTDIQKEIWNKFIYIAPLAAVGSVIRLPLGAYRDVPESRALLLQIMKEIESVARAQEVALDPDVQDQKLAAIDKMNPESINSMQRDVLSGKRFELEEFIGSILRAGKELKIPTLAHEYIYAVLKPIENEIVKKLQ
jgi:2-dehydropantoate 2-reductase